MMLLNRRFIGTRKMKTRNRIAAAVLIAATFPLQARVYYAADEPPGPDSLTDEAPLCYSFSAKNVEEQLGRLVDKYGDAINKIMILRSEDGTKVLQAHRTDETGRDVSYMYFENPKLCNDYQIRRIQETQIARSAPPAQQPKAPRSADEQFDVLATDSRGNQYAVLRSSVEHVNANIVAANAVATSVDGKTFALQIIASCSKREIGFRLLGSSEWVDATSASDANVLLNYLCWM